MTGFANPYVEIRFLDYVYFRLKAFVIPLDLTLISLNYSKDFENGPLCIGASGKAIIGKASSALSENVRQCSMSLYNLLYKDMALADSYVCEYNPANLRSVQIPESPWFSLYESGDVEYFGWCSI